MGTIKIRNANIVNEGQIFQADVWIESGLIKQIGKIAAEADQTIDATGKYLLPGLIDDHGAEAGELAARDAVVAVPQPGALEGLGAVQEGFPHRHHDGELGRLTVDHHRVEQGRGVRQPCVAVAGYHLEKIAQ